MWGFSVLTQKPGWSRSTRSLSCALGMVLWLGSWTGNEPGAAKTDLAFATLYQHLDLVVGAWTNLWEREREQSLLLIAVENEIYQDRWPECIHRGWMSLQKVVLQRQDHHLVIIESLGDVPIPVMGMWCPVHYSSTQGIQQNSFTKAWVCWASLGLEGCQGWWETPENIPLGRALPGTPFPFPKEIAWIYPVLCRDL